MVERRKSNEHKKRMIGVYVDSNMDRVYKSLAAQLGMSMSEFAELSMDAFVEPAFQEGKIAEALRPIWEVHQANKNETK